MRSIDESEVSLFLLIQIIGLAAVFFEIGSVQRKKRINILGFQLIGNALWVVHFLLLGAVTGAALNVVGAIRAYTFQRFGSSSNRSTTVLGVVLLLVLIIGAASWQGDLSILPLVATIVTTIGIWQLKEQRIRVIVLISSPLWFAYNLLIGSYAGVANEILLMVSILIALGRYRKLNN